MLHTCVIVEDVLFLREVYRFSFKNENIKIVAEAEDGIQALKLIEQHQPDFVLLDLVLPLKNGIDVLRQLSNIAQNTKCIVVSSLDDEEIIQKAKALGAVAYLKKPFTKSELIEKIRLVTNSFKEVQNG